MFSWWYKLPVVAKFLIVLLHFSSVKYSNDIVHIYKVRINDSSVWCKQDLTGSKLCNFKNICYDPFLMTFLFFLGNLTVIKGLSSFEDFQMIQLSSVNAHNQFEANISIVSINYDIKAIDYVKKGLLFSRFKPDNIMHIFHDDLIPLFLTMEDICMGDMTYCKETYQLVIHDNYLNGPYFNLYEIFSSFQPILLTNLSRNSNVLCFGKLHMGLVQDSIFYQYGFKTVQGSVENSKLSHSDLKRFTGFVKSGLGIEVEYDDKSHIVLVSRKKNRRILNDQLVTQMLERGFRKLNPKKEIEITTLDLVTDQITAFIKAIAQASILVGMHGAEMIFGIFLQANSTIIELFPYGIQPVIVSFIKPIAKIKGLHYIHWKNLFKNHSIFYPEASPLHGGISFLDNETQLKIKNIEKVPAVKCCDDPVYLYHMYQDTWVDSGFEDFVVRQMLKLSDCSPETNENKWFFPSVVSNVICHYNSFNASLNISWSCPFNVDPEALQYDIFVHESDSGLSKNIYTEETNLVVPAHVNREKKKFRIWISAIMKSSNTKSKDFFLECE